eukprot:SAG11_NODE_4634_length_1826_cov_1.086277_1_plen_142_part_00
MPEALWVSFKPLVASDESEWRLRYHSGATDIDPFNVVEHGAVHLHALGADGSVVCTKPKAQRPEVEIESLDVPVVSAGLMSPFPTALDNATADNSSELISDWLATGGWHYNVQNQIWCVSTSTHNDFDDRNFTVHVCLVVA